MPAQATLVIKDGQTTPADHSFVPKGSQKENGRTVAQFRDSTQTSLLGAWALNHTHTPPTSAVPEKQVFTVKLPATRLLPDGSTISPYFLKADIVYLIPQQATDAEINDLVAVTGNLANHAVVKSSVKGREGQW